MTDHSEWIAPAFIVVAILAVYLAMTYLPLSSWGITIPTATLWTYLPWLIAFGVGLYVLKEVNGGRHKK